MDKSFLELSQNMLEYQSKHIMHVRLVHGIALQMHGACKGLLNQPKTDLRYVKTTPKTY